MVWYVCIEYIINKNKTLIYNWLKICKVLGIYFVVEIQMLYN